MIKRIDLVWSLVIGEIAALLMLAVSKNVSIPAGILSRFYLLPYVFPVLTLLAMIVGALIGRAMPFVYQLVKFALVGGLNFLIDLGVLNFFISATGITSGFYASVFKAASFLTAVVSSFLWNKFWTFRALSVENAGQQFFQFFIVSLVGFLINVGVFALMNDVLGPQGRVDAKTWDSVSAAGAAAVGLVWNFLGYKFMVFKGEASVLEDRRPGAFRS